MKQAVRLSIALTVTFALVSCSSEPPPPPAPPPTCEELTSWSGEGVQVTASEELAASNVAPALCKVAGLIDGTINFELLLPDQWNGKFLMGGGGGYVGSVVNQALGVVPGLLQRGYATVGTDTGHSGTPIDASWALNEPEAEENFGHRAVHRTATVSKEIVRAFYGKPSDYSYFVGCSRGGGQGLIEAQRYPDDFDGIVSLAPAQHWTGSASDFVQNMQAIYPDPAGGAGPVITAENRALLQREILAACDNLDGVTDGILTDPRACTFDPATLPRCPGNTPGAECLTEAQLAAIQAVYQGLVVNGEEVFPGFPFGGENDEGGWDRWITGAANALGPGTHSMQYAFGTQFYKYLINDDPQWSYQDHDFSNWRNETAKIGELLNSTDPDLGKFRDSGGKLILGHGWSDPALTALYSVEYYEAAEEIDADLREYFRLFMLPGVLHCGGGPGPDLTDWLAALEGWVEGGAAPDQLIAMKLGSDGQPVLTRPLCPYPQVAIYDGVGDPNRAPSFSCGVR